MFPETKSRKTGPTVSLGTIHKVYDSERKQTLMFVNSTPGERPYLITIP